MSYYSYSSGQNYMDYIREMKYVMNNSEDKPEVFMYIPNRLLTIIADEQCLLNRSLMLQTEHPDAMKELSIISYIASEACEQRPELLSHFHWALANCIARMGHMGDSLDIMIIETDSPEQTLAFNHFDKARDAFFHKDFKMALREIDAAVYGSQTSSGYKSEWRFFLLQGIIHLGFFGCDIEMIDLTLAEEALLHAALLSQEGNLVSSSYAFMAASWAAYCNGKIKEANDYIGKTIEHNPKLHEAYYLAGKYQMDEGNVENGFSQLKNALEFDSFYALKAASDPSYLKSEDELTVFLKSYKHEKFENFRNKIFTDLNVLNTHTIPKDIQDIVDRFAEEKSLLELTRSELEWAEFKMRPVFITKPIEKLKIEHEAVVKVIEPYREKVVLKEATWYRKEESKIIIKNRVVERKKKVRYEVDIFKDRFMFFTGKILAEYDMVLVEGGKFTMGDSASIGRPDEKPVQDVELSSFMISRIQVTQKIWNLAMDVNPSNFHGYDLPVEHVSWYDCIEFCNILSKLAGFNPCYTIDKINKDPDNLNKNDQLKWLITCDWEADGYRLPTEAEWEFAAKGGSNGNFYRFAGSDNENMVCWHKDNSSYKTQNVALKKPNELGIYDMSGNVWEWCWDWYDNYAGNPLVNPLGPDKGAYRVLRGGSWADNLNYQRTSGRGKENPTGKYSSIGLRIVRNRIKK